MNELWHSLIVLPPFFPSFPRCFTPRPPGSSLCRTAAPCPMSQSTDSPCVRHDPALRVLHTEHHSLAMQRALWRAASSPPEITSISLFAIFQCHSCSSIRLPGLAVRSKVLLAHFSSSLNWMLSKFRLPETLTNPWPICSHMSTWWIWRRPSWWCDVLHFFGLQTVY